MAATKAFTNQPKFFLQIPITSKAKYKNVINKAPCIQPVTFTASGILKKYLSGMAINNKTKKEIPSAMPIILKR